MDRGLIHRCFWVLVMLFCFVVVLVGCSVEEVVFAPVSVTGLSVEINSTLELFSDSFDLQGRLVEEEILEGDELLDLLTELDIVIPDVPDTHFSFELELLTYELDREISDDDEIPKILPIPTHAEISVFKDGIVNFPRITFEDAGVFTYRISLVDTDGADWSVIASYTDVIIAVSEELETESLVARVEDNGFIFEVLFSYDLSDEVRLARVREWEKRVAEAYLAGYEYVENADGEFERVAIYVPTEPPTMEIVPEATLPQEVAYTPPLPTDPQEDLGVWGDFPEDSAVTISNADALSYLAVVNRNFRLSSSFSPGDLSVVNVRSINGTHLLRSSAARFLENFFSSAADAGHELVASSGYRSYLTQQATHNHWIAVMGETEARRVSARPGHSEHQLGLAVDITTPSLGGLSVAFSGTPEGIWVRENAHHFGFIIRYPANREADTGFVYEPWHLRFIGVDAATQMFGSGMILEEFMGLQ